MMRQKFACNLHNETQLEIINQTNSWRLSINMINKKFLQRYQIYRPHPTPISPTPLKNTPNNEKKKIETTAKFI